MKDFRAWSTSLVCSLSVVALLAAASAGVGAQTTTGRRVPTGTGRPGPPGANDRPSEVRPAPGIRERQLKMSEMEREASKPMTPEEERIALAQVAEDFQRIQVINNKMMGANIPAASPDYAGIAETTAEIRRRAARLKTNLALPEPDEKEKESKQPEYKKAEDAAQLKAALLSLDRTLMSFISNPIFKNPGVLEVSQAAKARRDLEVVIELSRLINKDAERLGKSAEKAR